MHAPALRRALPVEQVRPFLGIGNVIAVRIAVPLEIVRHFDVQRAVGIGEALELDPALFAHDAARAFAADDIAAAQGLLLARFVFDDGGDAVRILAEPGKGRPHPDHDQRARLRHGKRLFHDLDALALQRKGKGRVVPQRDVIELGDQLALFAVPVMEQRRHDAARFEFLVKPDLVIHLQRRRMIGAGARHLIEKILIAKLFHDGARHAFLGELQRKAQAHGSRANNQHTVLRMGHVRRWRRPFLSPEPRLSPRRPSHYG